MELKKINLLILEDSKMDAEMVIRILENSGINGNITVATNRDEFVQALNIKTFDAILADNQLLGFNAQKALQILRERNFHIPFILVTGSIEDEYAVEIMKEGATDYILKDRLHRLPNALLGSIQKFSLEKERNRYLDEVIANESIMAAAARLANFGSWEVNFVNKTFRWSDEQYRILGYDPGEVEPTIDNLLKRIHPDDFEIAKRAVNAAFKYGTRQHFDSRIVHKDGAIIYISGEMVATCDDTGKMLRMNGFTQDVSHTREAELKEKKISGDLLQRNKDLEQFAYIVSHNLRAPVANIVGLTNELNEDGLDETDRSFFIKAIASSVLRLENVITDLNNILQVTHHVDENKELVNFNDLLDEIKSGMELQLFKRNVKINCDFSELEGLQTLKSYMRSIFYNLISNSIKFRRQNVLPEIEIKSYLDKSNKGLIFSDNGIGIDLNRNSNNLFGLYKRFNPDHAEGKGIGLFMVKSQVETLGGKIFVESLINEGTTFHIQFAH